MQYSLCIAQSFGQEKLFQCCEPTRPTKQTFYQFLKMPKIHRNISAEEAVTEMTRSKVEAAIFVQCLNSCPDEVAWVESLAAKHPLIKGIVGGLDLTQVF